MSFINDIYLNCIQNKGKSSEEYSLQLEKCITLYKELFEKLNENSKKEMLELESETAVLENISNEDSFVKGFKTAVKIFLCAVSE